jgi:hypothetical protein
MTGAQAPGGQLSSEDMAALEEMVLNSDIDLET